MEPAARPGRFGPAHPFFMYSCFTQMLIVDEILSNTFSFQTQNQCNTKVFIKIKIATQNNDKKKMKTGGPISVEIHMQSQL
jgi:hypothetical protein